MIDLRKNVNQVFENAKQRIYKIFTKNMLLDTRLYVLHNLEVVMTLEATQFFTTIGDQNPYYFTLARLQAGDLDEPCASHVMAHEDCARQLLQVANKVMENEPNIRGGRKLYEASLNGGQVVVITTDLRAEIIGNHRHLEKNAVLFVLETLSPIFMRQHVEGEDVIQGTLLQKHSVTIIRAGTNYALNLPPKTKLLFASSCGFIQDECVKLPKEELLISYPKFQECAIVRGQEGTNPYDLLLMRLHADDLVEKNSQKGIESPMITQIGELVTAILQTPKASGSDVRRDLYAVDYNRGEWTLLHVLGTASGLMTVGNHAHRDGKKELMVFMTKKPTVMIQADSDGSNRVYTLIRAGFTVIQTIEERAHAFILPQDEEAFVLIANSQPYQDPTRVVLVSSPDEASDIFAQVTTQPEF